MRAAGQKMCLVWIFIAMLAALAGCASTSEKAEYYSDSSNYVTAAGKLTYIRNDAEHDAVYLAIEDLTPAFSDPNFKIQGENYRLACERGLMEALEIGQTVTFQAAPKYFGDGYVIPIAGITVDGSIYLDFEDGKANIINEMK